MVAFKLVLFWFWYFVALDRFEIQFVMIKSTIKEVHWMYGTFVLTTDAQLSSWWPIKDTSCLITELHFLNAFILSQDKILALILWCQAVLMFLSPNHCLNFFRCFRGSCTLISVDCIAWVKVIQICLAFFCIGHSRLSFSPEVVLSGFLWLVIIKIPKLDLLWTWAIRCK